MLGISATTLAKTRQTWRAGGQLVTTHGYVHESLRRANFHVTARHDADRAARVQAFFKHDAHSEADGFDMRRPEDYPMLHQLKRDFGDRFARRDEFMERAAMNVPRSTSNDLPRRYLLKFRFPARERHSGRMERPCVRGVECSFVERIRALKQTGAYNADLVALYAGREFLLPAEDRAFEENGILPATHGMCYDCELRAYSESVWSRIANQRPPTMQINRFTVKCETGNFDPQDMLPEIIHGNVPTGIVGYVPRYDTADRGIAQAIHPEDPERQPVWILADTTQDF